MSRVPILRWLSSSIADSIGRMMLQLLATVLFARRLPPEAFGTAALAMVAAGTLSVLVTAPFEEALTQRRRVRKAHFSAALTAVLLAGIVLAALAPRVLSLPDGVDPRLAWFSLVLLANGPIAVLTAAYRRWRRFGVLAASSFAGQLLGTAAGLVLVFGCDAAIWGLLAVQLVSRATTLAILALSLPVRLEVRWSTARLGELSRFAGWHLAGRCVEALGDAAYQFLVVHWFGLAANGLLNMAMRVVEPIRGASGAIGHNIATAFFAPAQQSPGRLRTLVTTATIEASSLLLPVFIGLAVISPALIALLAGPDWSAAAPLASCLALGAAFGTVANLLHSALAATGRAEVGFAAGLLDSAIVVLCLVLFRSWGLLAVGLARLLPYVTDLALVAVWSRWVLELPDRAMLVSLLQTVFSVGLMATAAAWLGMATASMPPAETLALQVTVGVAAYGLSMLALQPALARRLVLRLR